MATQNVAVTKTKMVRGLKTAIPVDRYDVYTSEPTSGYIFKTGSREPQTIVVVYELRGSSNTWVKATMDTT